MVICLTAAPVTPLSAFTGSWHFGWLPCKLLPLFQVSNIPCPFPEKWESSFLLVLPPAPPGQICKTSMCVFKKLLGLFFHLPFSRYKIRYYFFSPSQEGFFFFFENLYFLLLPFGFKETWLTSSHLWLARLTAEL